METRFNSAEAEQSLYRLWEESGAFKSGKDGKKPFTIVMPPPNVTGRLHIGHALDNTLQDILVRYKRMQGYDCLWLPGTDHAGIATQLLVEKQLAEQGIQRKSLTREQFLEHVWKWKEQYGEIILQQLRQLGASCDWDKARFTMDEGVSEAVRHAFVRLHEEGLIYRDERLVNWDPSLETAVSDLEVKQEEIDGALYFIAYSLVDAPEQNIVVATTRPETLFGDTAVAVNPKDERYKNLIERQCLVPLTTRAVRIIADEEVDMKQGSGALKITPAHDFHDFEIARRHDLPALSIFDTRAHMTEVVPESYRGLERFEARKKILEDLTACGALERTIKPYRHSVPHGERSGVVLEPRLTKQWFVDAKPLAERALHVVKKGKTRLVPETWGATWRHWLENIQPWCISRQLWWGHRIPVWYAEDGTPFAALNEAGAKRRAKKHFGHKVELRQDEDVLDTWFSSALWPFSTLGWPKSTPLLKKHFPTDVLVTGFDILFFWVARMMMFSLHFMGQVPFKIVAMHPLIRDARGKKMSKSLGNVVDPLDLVQRYGCDALRLSLTLQATPARDIRLSEPRIKGNRDFVTKLWNAARLLELNDCRFDPDFSFTTTKNSSSAWMMFEFAILLANTEIALATCRFHVAAESLYHVTWDKFCDRYLETIKPFLWGEDSPEKTEMRKASASLLFILLRCLHPIIPFVTEKIYQEAKIFENKSCPLLINTEWPGEEELYAASDVEGGKKIGYACKEMDWLYALVDKVRSLRSTLGLSPRTLVSLHYQEASPIGDERLARWQKTLAHMATLEWTGSTEARRKHENQKHVGFVCEELISPALVLPSNFDVSAAQQKMKKDLELAIKQQNESRDKLFFNDDFNQRAPREVIVAESRKLREADKTIASLQRALASLREGLIPEEQ